MTHQPDDIAFSIVWAKQKNDEYVTKEIIRLKQFQVDVLTEILFTEFYTPCTKEKLENVISKILHEAVNFTEKNREIDNDDTNTKT